MELYWSEKSEYIGIVGRRGENETRILTFDCTSALQDYPEAEILCIMQRPGDAQPYTHEYTQDGDTITIALTAADMCRVGTFKLELRLMQNEKILKSAIYRGGIALSLHYGEPECGEAVDLLNRIDKTLKDATETAARLETSLDGVDDAIDRLDAATDSATATDKQAQENEKTRGKAEKERVEAENGRILAENSRQQQENERADAEFIRSQNERLRYGNENQRITNESERTRAENARNTAESSRVASENTRIQAESERVKAETSRAEAEQSRLSAEETRISAEKARAAAETLRVQQEQRRETAETSRAEAERQRESMETSRQTAETARNAAESGRAKAEKARVSAESQRQQAETARADAEGKRVQAEQGRVTAEQGRVKAEVQREEAMAQHAEKIAELESEVAKKAQIDDTTVSGTSAWSSQHIVDVLCPPLEASGNPVVCYPVAGSNLGVTARWEPTQEGSGEPSPENIRPINGRTAVKMGRFGANLVTPFYQSGYTIEKNGLTFVVNDDYSVTVAGTATKEIYFNYQTLPYNTVSYLFSAMDKTVEKDGFIACDIAVQPYPNEGTRFYLVFTKGAAVNKTYYPQCVYGNTLPPYKIGNGSTTTLALSNTIYGGEVGADGEGRETWGYIESYAGEALPAEWICDRAVYAEGGTPPTGAQVAYKLATPIPFTATGGGAVKALSGTNTILTDADTLTVTGRADPIHIIQQLQAASAASAQALADVERAVTDI